MRALLLLALVACGGSDGTNLPFVDAAPADAWGQPCDQLSAGRILLNHGHTLTFPASVAEDSALGETVRYVGAMGGDAGHVHDVVITAAQWTEVKDPPMLIDITSEPAEGHTHMVQLSCVRQ